MRPTSLSTALHAAKQIDELGRCPGCDLTTNAIERKPVAFSHGLVDVTYVCETCLTHTIRAIKPDDKGLI